MKLDQLILELKALSKERENPEIFINGGAINSITYVSMDNVVALETTATLAEPDFAVAVVSEETYTVIEEEVIDRTVPEDTIFSETVETQTVEFIEVPEDKEVVPYTEEELKELEASIAEKAPMEEITLPDFNS